jgi:hypothetical protein
MERAIISSIKDKDGTRKSWKTGENARGQRKTYDDHIIHELTTPKTEVAVIAVKIHLIVD